MTPEKALLGIVIKKDGTVPFDEGYSPELRAHTIAVLFDQGHKVSAVPGTPHLKIADWDHPNGKAKALFHSHFGHAAEVKYAG